MKLLLLIRHAKSSWDYAVSDRDRPLNERGIKNAPEMAKRLLKKKIEIDRFISSPATRAYTTAVYFAGAYDVKNKHIITVPALYEATLNVFYSVVEDQNDSDKTVAIFSHNPGITEFANSLSNARINNMPTCGIFAVKANIKLWKDFKNAPKEFLFFDFPKLTH
ncbi:MAG: histidine phosphatase family protein [Segetibacter sp.]|nr:histidine phosphatase family protein [Segetibacter sp.]